VAEYAVKSRQWIDVKTREGGETEIIFRVVRVLSCAQRIYLLINGASNMPKVRTQPTIRKAISKVDPRHHSRTSSRTSNGSNHSTTDGVPITNSDSASDDRPVQVHNSSTDTPSSSSRHTCTPSFTEQKLERKAEREHREKVETEASARRAKRRTKSE